MEVSKLPFHALAPMADIDYDPPYPGSLSVPGVFPTGFWTNPPPNMPAHFSTRRGTFPFRPIPSVLPLQVARSNYSADVFRTAEKYTKQFPDLINRIDAMPSRWEDLFEYFDVPDIYIESPGFCYHVIHRIAWHALMKKRRFARLVENWCLQNIHKLATLPFTGSPVKKLLDAGDWHYFNFSNIPEQDMNMICSMLDRQAFEIKPMVDRFGENVVSLPDSAITEGNDQTRSVAVLNATSSPNITSRVATECFGLGFTNHETRVASPAPPHESAGSAQGNTSATSRCDISQAKKQQEVRKQSQPGSKPLPKVDLDTKLSVELPPKSEQKGPSQPPQLMQRASSGYSITETLAELKEDIVSPIPRVALPGQPQQAPAHSRPAMPLNVPAMFNAGANYTIAAAEKRLIGIRIADAYDTANILKSEMIPKIMAAYGEIESYRPRVSDAELTFVSPASAKAACSFNNKSVDNGPRLLVYLIPNFDNSPHPTSSIMDISHRSPADGDGLRPQHVGLSPQPHSRPRVDTITSWASAAVFKPQTSGSFPEQDPGGMRAQLSISPPRVHHGATNSQSTNASLGMPHIPPTPLIRPPLHPAPSAQRYIGSGAKRHVGVENRPIQPPRNPKALRQPYQKSNLQPAVLTRSPINHNMNGVSQPAKMLYNSRHERLAAIPRQADRTHETLQMETMSQRSEVMNALNKTPPHGAAVATMNGSSGPMKPSSTLGCARNSPAMRDPSLSCDARNGPNAPRLQRRTTLSRSLDGVQSMPPQVSTHTSNLKFEVPHTSLPGVAHGTQTAALAVFQPHMSSQLENIPISSPNRMVWDSKQHRRADANASSTSFADTEFLLVPLNIVGWIIGAQSYRIRRLNRTTGCYIHLNPDMADTNMVPCSIKGPETARPIARALIHRLAADAEANGINRERPELFFLPSDIADVLNGRYRGDVARIEALTGAGLRFDEKDEPGLHMRSCFIAGPVPVRQIVLEQIDCIADIIRMETSNGAIGAQSFLADFGHDRDYLGSLNGNIRRRIATICFSTQCQIHILLSNTQPQSMTLCQIVGPHTNLAAAYQQLTEILSSNGERTPHQPPSGDDTFAISDAAAFYVFGQHGNNIRVLEDETGCRITVQRLQPDRDSDLLIHVVTVAGLHERRPKVVAEIRRLAAQSETKALETPMSDAEGLRLILESVTAPLGTNTSSPKMESISDGGSSDGEGIRRLFESITGPPTENDYVASGHTKSGSSIRLEDVERLSDLAVYAQHRESFSDDIEVCGEDIRRSAVYVQKPPADHINLPAAVNTTPAHVGSTEDQARVSEGASNEGQAADTLVQRMAYTELTLPAPSTEASLKDKDSYKFHKKFRPSTPSHEGDSTGSVGYQRSAPAKRPYRKNKKKARKNPATESGQDSSYSMMTTDDDGSGIASGKNSTHDRSLKAPRMSRQDSMRSMASATSSSKSAKGAASRKKKSAEIFGSIKQQAAASGEADEGNSSLSSFSLSTRHHHRGRSALAATQPKFAADLTQAHAAAPAAGTPKPLGEKSASVLNFKENRENKDRKRDRGRKLEADVVNVLDDPKEWPTLSGRPAGQSVSERALSPLANLRSPSGRRDSMAAIAGRAKGRMMSDAESLSRPSSRSRPENGTETVDMARGVGSGAVNSGVPVMPAKGLATKEWPTVVEWNGKRVSLTDDEDVEETQELNNKDASEMLAVAEERKQGW